MHLVVPNGVHKVTYEMLQEMVSEAYDEKERHRDRDRERERQRQRVSERKRERDKTIMREEEFVSKKYQFSRSSK